MESGKSSQKASKIEDMLSSSEKKMYARVLKEIEQNQSFFASANTEEIIAYFVENCGFSKKGIYTLFKKITEFDNKKK